MTASFRLGTASLFAITCLAQTAPTFEVASIKLGLSAPEARSVGKRPGFKIDAARVEITSTPLVRLIQYAYRLQPYQLQGQDRLPASFFDIIAKVPDGASLDQVPEMLQSLLADRFKLVVRRQTANRPVYALVVSEGGSKLKDAPSGDLGRCARALQDGSS